MRRALAAFLVTAAMAAGGTARAQPGGNDAAIAETLFEEGRRLMIAGDFAHACPKLAESQRLDPGVGTVLNLGDCYEKDHKLASAWAAFVEAEALAQRAGHAARARYAADKSAALEPRIAHLVVRVAEESRAPSLVVLRDRELLGEATWGTAMPIDAGVHVIEVEAPGRRPFRREVIVGDGPVSVQVDVPPLEEVESAPPPAPIVLSIPPPAPPPPEPRANATLRWWGVGIGGAGVVGVGAGLVLGAIAMGDDAHTRDLGCTRTTCPTLEGVAAAHQARAIANVATAATVVGAVAIAAGVTLVILSLPSARARAALQVGPSSVHLEGTF